MFRLLGSLSKTQRSRRGVRLEFDPLEERVTPIATTTTVLAATPTVYGQPVTLTAMVAPNPGGREWHDKLFR